MTTTRTPLDIFRQWDITLTLTGHDVPRPANKPGFTDQDKAAAYHAWRRGFKAALADYATELCENAKAEPSSPHNAERIATAKAALLDAKAL